MAPGADELEQMLGLVSRLTRVLTSMTKGGGTQVVKHLDCLREAGMGTLDASGPSKKDQRTTMVAVGAEE